MGRRVGVGATDLLKPVRLINATTKATHRRRRHVRYEARGRAPSKTVPGQAHPPSDTCSDLAAVLDLVSIGLGSPRSPRSDLVLPNVDQPLKDLRDDIGVETRWQ